MNTGIQDSITLARALAETLQDGKEGRVDEWAALSSRLRTA
jgi:2-polyprenyl-6-methoxyphenol hydroxylase-like FAD-dependent oxidoreductase